ncbi:hypothetical protein Dda_6378 [Drechslerella dactyloides]|uniref:J domain-containing protein n=1 Tax=Drechslerella dactyloides TaxID=74499 RepID=A0AAD6NIV7_DREDA|nr:hypothetical protein Dda_6378 [Drechslerella dactyloides]
MGPPPEDLGLLPDWYAVLELAKEASPSAIRTAYKRLAFQYHPDKTPDEKLKPEMTKRFTQIQEAYEVLSDSRKKREYDEDLALESRIKEEYRRAQEMKERQMRSRKAQQRNKQEEMMREKEDRQAELDYLAAKRQEEDLLRAAKQVQEARRQHAAAAGRKASVATERPQDDRQRRKEDDRRAKQEQKRLREEELHRIEVQRLERERLQREEEKKQYARDSEKRTRDRRHDRGQKDHMQFPIDDILDTEPIHFDRPEKPHNRGRSSKERLHEPSLHVPRDTSKVRDRSPRGRDGSRHRERDRESDFSTRDFESSRRNQFYESARRMSTEPLHDEYMRGPGSHYGSPPHSYTVPRSAAYSPPSSPKLRHSNPTMNTTHSFQTPNKGRDRTRERPGERSRKHSEAGLYGRDPYPSSIPEDMNTSLPGNNRDSGYSTDPRLSAEKLDSKMYSNVNGKKYKAKVMYVTDSEDDGTSTVGKSRSTKRATKQTSREDSHASYAPRHQPEMDDSMLDDPFRFMQTGSKTFPYTHKDVNYSAKPTVIHTRSNSDHSNPPPDITIDFINAGLAGMSTSGHKSARHRLVATKSEGRKPENRSAVKAVIHDGNLLPMSPKKKSAPQLSTFKPFFYNTPLGKQPSDGDLRRKSGFAPFRQSPPKRSPRGFQKVNPYTNRIED